MTDRAYKRLSKAREEKPARESLGGIRATWKEG